MLPNLSSQTPNNQPWPFCTSHSLTHTPTDTCTTLPRGSQERNKEEKANARHIGNATHHYASILGVKIRTIYRKIPCCSFFVVICYGLEKSKLRTSDFEWTIPRFVERHLNIVLLLLLHSQLYLCGSLFLEGWGVGVRFLHMWPFFFLIQP